MTLGGTLLILSWFARSITSLIIPEIIHSGNNDASHAKLNERDTLDKNQIPFIIPTHGPQKNFIPDQYIVLFENDTTDLQISRFEQFLSSLIEEDNQKYNVNDNYSKVLSRFQISNDTKGMIIRAPIDDFLEDVKNNIFNYQKIIKIIERDSYVHMNKFTTQIDSSWGLSRISQRNHLKLLQDQFYFYDDNGSGKGVDCYILDTGINSNHIEFEGRASWGVSLPVTEPSLEDSNGHGTHCAGIIGSKTYGVAKETNLIAVKVLDFKGDGSMSDVILGLEFVANSHTNKTNNISSSSSVHSEFKGSVVNLSLGAPKSPSLDIALESAKKIGIHITVAAGNEDEDACMTSPADSPAVITVGASSFSDDRAFFSNWGPCVDVFAPGINIKSTYIGPNNNETLSLSGSSMSSPFVSGLTAYYLSLQPDVSSQFHDSLMTPDQLKRKIIDFSTNGMLKELPLDTANKLVYNGGGKDLSGFWNATRKEN
ncbi:putative subtilisin-like protease YSP3 NDAI_0I02280 [Naumovozyma dairenensis CBS 421]|uniref:Peptidase S8/S53 domain-containing protein n=1 Tax=Naumovozyma dairenensis (strain ATCC 10597 / BCRC 20456 / CBS 421 / NBRC 0211 / NRRL Y-12639) TaxID=1071378 RepID=G0WG86_NAUDC|nr:hypothetical protein NDAI_0I02280 [Naumovozyma dairenensis CBS 421]CCD26797.1 hypothetical protein NDAI_0I02280 [Naumovozyma dairenensis CBS 421]